jgi:hypothetical protein
MLENQIYSIESANINQETLLAMKNASKAMKDIHGNLTIDKVDDIMYASPASEFLGCSSANPNTGKASPNSAHSPKKSATPSQMVRKLVNRLMRAN